MKKLAENTLQARAKVLYFDQNKSIEVIFGDEFGRFAYNEQTLLEVNRGTDTKVFKIVAKNFKNVDVSKVKTLKQRNEEDDAKKSKKEDKK